MVPCILRFTCQTTHTCVINPSPVPIVSLGIKENPLGVSKYLQNRGRVPITHRRAIKKILTHLRPQKMSTAKSFDGNCFDGLIQWNFKHILQKSDSNNRNLKFAHKFRKSSFYDDKISQLLKVY